MTRRSIIVAGTTTMGALLCRPAIAGAAATGRTPETDEISVGSGQTYVVRRTTRARLVTIAKGGTIIAPEGHSLTMTIDGVETGGVLTEAGGSDTRIAPGTYRGARLDPKNGIILQVMENDDPGPVMIDGKVVNEGVYHEPTGDPTKVDSFDVIEAHGTDAVAIFTDIALKGDFYSGIRGGGRSSGPGGPGGGGQIAGLNLVLTFDRAKVEGVISATRTKHHLDTISSANYLQLGEVVNTVSPVVNNGVIVQLNNGSTWTVTGTSYLSKLVVAQGARVVAPNGRTVSMTVDGNATAITPGHTYTGVIAIKVTQPPSCELVAVSSPPSATGVHILARYTPHVFR
ncbi:hypothetical protein [Actinoallomurus vinaceus]